MKIRYTNSVDDIVAFVESHNRAANRRTFWVIVIGMTILALVFGAAVNAIWGFRNWQLWTLVGSLFFGLFYRSGFERSIRRAYRRFMSEGRNEALYCEHTLELDGGYLYERTAVSDHRILVSALEDVVSTDSHTFVYIQGIMAHVIPTATVLEGDPHAFSGALRAAMRDSED